MLPLWNDADHSVRVGRLKDTEEIEALVRLFEDVAEEKGWFPDGALRQSIDRSVYFALEAHDHLAGGLQLVSADRDGRFAFQEVWPEFAPSHHGRSAHVAIMAFSPAFRGEGRLFWHLAAEMWRHCVGTRVTKLYIETSPRILPIYRRLGWPLKTEGELRRQWGAPTYLCSLGIPDVAEALLRRSEHSTYYRQIVSQAFRVDMAPMRASSVAVRHSGVTACVAG
jgi:hypothetical protein